MKLDVFLSTCFQLAGDRTTMEWDPGLWVRRDPTQFAEDFTGKSATTGESNSAHVCAKGLFKQSQTFVDQC